MPRNQKLNEAMRAASRREILSAAGTLFAQKGFFNVRMAEIARQASMSPGNLYWHFAGKEAILKALIGEFFEAYERMLIEAENYPAEPQQKLNHLIELQLALFGDMRANFNIYMSILGHGGSAFLKNLGFDTKKIGKRYQDHLTHILEGAIQAGVIPPQPPLFLSIFFFSFFNGLVLTYGADWRKLPPAMVTRAALRLLGCQEETPVPKE